MRAIENIKPQVDFNINRIFNPALVEYVTYAVDNPHMENHVGDTIRKRLRELGKSQEWLAGEMDVSSNAVSKWIKTGKISRENAIRVAGILRMSVEQLLANSERSIAPAPAVLSLVHVSQEELTILSSYRECNADGQQAIRNSVKNALALFPSNQLSIGNHKQQ